MYKNLYFQRLVMSQRQRGRSLSACGIAAVKTELLRRGWNNQLLADHALLSISTIKRMLRGEPKDVASLNAALETLGLTIDPHLKKIQLPPASVVLASEPIPVTPVEIVAPNPNTHLSFYMNAIYQDTKIPQIKCTLVALKEQLVDSEIIFDTQSNRLTISGVFTPEAQASIEATIRHLERLFTNCRLIGDITCAENREPLLAISAVTE